MVTEEIKEILEQLAKLDQEERLDLKDLLVHKAKLGLLVQLGPKDSLDQEVSQVLLVNKDNKEQLELKGKEVQLVHKVNEENKDHQDPLGLLDQGDKMVIKEIRARQDQLDQVDNPVHQGQEVMLDPLDLEGQQDHQVRLVRLVK